MKRIIFGVFLLAMVTHVFLFNHVEALSCSSITKEYNSSIYNACRTMSDDKNDSGDWWGTLWINGSSNPHDLTDFVQTNKSSGTITVYLHGSAICDNNSYGCGDKYCHYIKILNTTYEYPNGSDIGWTAYNKLKNWAPLSDIPSSLTRPSFGWYQEQYSVAKAMKLDIDKMKNMHSPSRVTSKYKIYNIPLQGYRVGNSNDPTTGGSSQKSDLTISIPNEAVYSGASSAGSNGTGYVKKNTTAPTYYYNGCSPTTGCKVRFKHDLKRESGDKATSYTITRSSNLPYNSSTRKGIDGGTLANSSINGSGTVRTEDLILYPGMVVCESLTFTVNDYTGERATTTVCASALGDAQPPDPNPDGPSGDQAFVNIKTKNEYANSRYHTYQRSVYAKPGDKLSWYSTYNPVLQYTAFLRPEQVRVDNKAVHGGNGNTLQTLFNIHSGLPNWRNGYSVQVGRNNSFSGAISNDNYDAGDTSFRYREQKRITEVLSGDVGKEVDGQAITSLNSVNLTTPGQVSFTNNGGSNLGTVYSASRSQIARGYVPYNFKTRTEITTPENEPGGEPNTLPSGGEVQIEYDVDILKKSNDETTNDNKPYATRADDVKHQLVVYNPDLVPIRPGGELNNSGRDANVCSYFGYNGGDERFCGVSDSNTETLGPGSHHASSSFYAQDIKAGSRICVASAVFPGSSGADTNWNDKNYSLSWRISDSKCYLVSKHPSIQVWGGSIYSRGNINTATSEKYHLLGYDTYSVKSFNDYFVFGSWNELGVVTNGGVVGFGSGASMGYASNSGGGNTWPYYTYKAADGTTLGYHGIGNTASGGAPGGSNKRSFCNRIPLTIPNEGCSGDVSSTVGLSSAISVAEASRDKQSIIDVLNIGGTEFSGVLTSENVNGINGNEIKTFGTRTGDITIASDLVYFDTETPYHTYQDMPRLIIYAKNIYISCNVERIDALLIADDTVKTCAESGDNDVNLQQNSRQLFINGAVIANRLIANRTYGAATGANSIVPAEIINFDPTLYEFGNTTTNDDDVTGRLDVVYMHELAPRR